ncbi:MAG: homoserine kinase [Acidobacteria bacterium]|nr:homoserine kinase [Acidobacteriota bacterium]
MTQQPLLHSFEIIVPGSISNLGPGLDTLAVAVELYLRLRVEVLPSQANGLEFNLQDLDLVGENRIEQAFRAVASQDGAVLPDVRVRVWSDIPLRAGLGSSGAATVAGLKLYEALARARPVDEWLSIATLIEGHPDNAAAALLGGITTSCQHEDGRVTARAWRWPAAIRAVVAIPALPLETAVARRVLPAAVSLKDAIFNVQRMALLLRALESGAYEDLREALRDRWHQPHRQPLVPGLAEALALEHPSLLGVCLSGAGPSVVALAAQDEAEIAELLAGVYRRLGIACQVRTLAAAREGARLEPVRIAESL